MLDQDAELFNDSLDRCTRRPGFIDRFYEIFLASSPEVADKFKHTNFKKQTRALKASLYIMMSAHDWTEESATHLDRLAKSHSRHELNIRPELYDVWEACLLQAAREFDPQFTAEVEQAWHNILRPGIEFMKSRY